MLPDPRLPTHHPPGSPGKVEVLRERARLRLSLFLAGDAVDCRLARRGRGRPLSPRTAAKLAVVEEGLRRGVPYRTLARLARCSCTTIAVMAKLARRRRARAG